MNKTLQIIQHEYTRQVFRKRFWIYLISVPLVLLLVTAFSVFFSISSLNTEPVGYVDLDGLITQPFHPRPSNFFNPSINLIPFQNQTLALQAVKSDQIQGFVIIPAGYESTYQLTYLSNERPSSEVTHTITRFISDNLLAGEDIPNLTRITQGSQMTLQSLDGQTTSTGTGWHRIIVPAAIGIIYFVLVLFSGSYLQQSLVEEKENRTIEILLTSVSSNQLMAGKIIGNISVGLTQLTAWALILLIGLIFFIDKLPLLADLQISWTYLLISLLFLLPSFVFTASIMAALGATLTEAQESQQFNGLIIIPMMLPIYLFNTFMNSPNGLLARVLSLIPLSAPLSMALRMAFTTVPLWEILLTLLILITLAVAAVWLAGKAFRIGMLQYNKRLPLKQLLRKEVKNA